MKPSTLFAALSAGLLFCAANLSYALDNAADAAKAAAPSKPASSTLEAKAKKTAPVKLVDINSATKKQLKTLPGIGDAEADKIIAGRPYGSKAWLATHNVLAPEIFAAIRDQIVATQTKAITDQIMAKQK